jgi:hypothetical protein
LIDGTDGDEIIAPIEERVQATFEQAKNNRCFGADNPGSNSH